MIRTLIVTVAVGAALGPLAGCGSGCNPGPAPSSETCETPGTGGTVTEVQIGHWDGEAYDRYEDGDVVPMVTGGQGFPMLVFHLLVRGSDIPSCLAQETTVWVGDLVEGSEVLPLTTTRVQEELWLTGEALVVTFGVSSGERVRVEAEVGGVVESVDLWVDYAPLPDAAL